jgi:adenylate cyclase
MPPTERKLAAILSADVVGYSRLMAEDEAGTIRTLATYREEVGVLVRHHRGRVADFTGDNFLTEFPTALDAVECAAEVQRVLRARNAGLPEGRRMEFRMGVHLGDVAVEDDRLYGDGVNIAARLEGLAEAGGICVSAEVYGQVQRRLELDFDDLGEQSLKNIPDPVHVYRMRLEPGAESSPLPLPGMDDLTVPGFGGAPAIAVLPFDNLSGDPEQEYFADGLAEDLITRLSTSHIPVIARNSSFTYKGEPVDVKRVSRELGVRYVVEGTVRRAGERVRISAQLIDAATGQHVWAERYDRPLVDVFVVQDEVTEAIVGSVYPAWMRSERERVAGRAPESLDAWQSFQRGIWHLLHMTREENARAQSFYERAIELDPHFSRAFAGLSTTHLLAVILQSTDDPGRSIAEALRAAQTAVTLDDSDPHGHISLGGAYMASGQREEAIAAFELAIELSPSDPLAHSELGQVLALSGRADEALKSLERAIRLSPRDPMMWYTLMAVAMAHFGAECYAEAVEWARRSLQRNPGNGQAYVYLAASYAHLGETDKARAALQEFLRLVPDFSLARLGVLAGAMEPAFFEHLLDGLRKAGLEE